MTFGKGSWFIEDEEECFKILKKCFDNGLRTFDTANVYSNGISEKILGKFIKHYNIPRERIVIMTKVYFPVDYEDDEFRYPFFDDGQHHQDEYVNSQGLSRKHIMDAIDQSVKNLGTYVDVYQIHRLDSNVPKKEILKALHDVVESGKVRYIGASSMKTYEFVELQYIAEINGWTKFISMQNYYNLLYREEEREMNAYCQYNDLAKVGLIPYSPIARGILARPFGSKATNRREKDTFRFKQVNLDQEVLQEDKKIIDRVGEVAQKHKVSRAAVATYWTMIKGTAPVVGLNSIKRVEEILEVFTFDLTKAELEYLEEPYKSKNVVY